MNPRPETKDPAVPMMTLEEREVLARYRDELAARSVCAVTGERPDVATAKHLVDQIGMPTGWVFTPEGAEKFITGPAAWIPEIDATWRLE
ncbi:hypothetical protein [Leucobacter sp. cx-169]|uniref:hypothetical protein n=1 Tax=Leucobacter sp. cx-169 TaxID=2770549 RepID=UPI00165EB01F|nr:hypothetical protein [Leucobacter sp. cx-169]MBC9927320.1 hypothetical protein [Leucobacter sp. cx-169]